MKIISDAMSRGYHRKILLAKKNSPHIAFGLGIAGFVGTTVLASKASLSLRGQLDDIQMKTEAVKEGEPDASVRKKELASVYVRGSAQIARLYGPTIVVGGLSVAALTGSHVTLTRRNTALSAAFYAVHKAFDDYRERVRDEYGVEKELDLYHAAHDRKVKNEAGKDEIVKVVNSNLYSPYARCFDESNPNWKRDQDWNQMFVKAQQNYANQLLVSRGHLMLNEVYAMLGFDHTTAGQVVGWVISKDAGDNFVDFGMFEGQANDFVNGWERNIILDFNVDGVVYHLIGG